MLERKVRTDLINWKNNHKNNCLFVVGARQIGKTFIIRDFAKEFYESVIEINFIEKNEYKDIFVGNLDVETILKKMSINIPNMKIIPGKTLIFLDEIQDCEDAITALKFLAMDKRFDVIASGSMLGIAYRRAKSFPVGYVEFLEMHSLDFEEFCWANGVNRESIQYLKEFFDLRKPVPLSVHTRMMDLFKEYIVLGGMPQVVDDFVHNNNFSSAFNLQKNIVRSYKNDILKYADEEEKIKIMACFDSIPKHLSQDYKKFKYNLIEKKGTSSKYSSALRWLYDAGIINFCYNLSKPELPLAGNAKEDVFKVYMRDTGLLMAMLEDGSQLEIINGNLGIYKGAIYENIIADIFTKLGKKLYYFEHNSTLEIDFFIRYENKATAVEVKSADNTKSKSLNSVMENWKVEKGIRLSSKNLGEKVEDNGILYIPLYMAMFL